MHHVCIKYASIFQLADGLCQLFPADVGVNLVSDVRRFVTDQSLYRNMVYTTFTHPGCERVPGIMSPVPVKRI